MIVVLKCVNKLKKYNHLSHSLNIRVARAQPCVSLAFLLLSFSVSSEMSETVKCPQCNIVIDELLCYVQNKLSTSDDDTLIRICFSAFSYDEIKNSKALLFDSVPTNIRNIKRKQKGKEHRDLADIIGLLKSTDPDVIPIFVARHLDNLPPITFDHLDVTKLLKDLTLLKDEVRELKSTSVTVDQLEKLKTDLQYDLKFGSLIENAQNEQCVNLRRGGGNGDISLSSSSFRSLEVSTKAVQNPKNKDSEKLSVQIADTHSPLIPCSGYVEKDRPLSASKADSMTRARLPSPGLTAVRVTSQSQRLNSVCKQVPDRGGVLPTKENDGWIVATHRKPKQKYRYAGKAGVAKDTVGCFKAAEKKVPMFITNVHKDSYTADIIKHIEIKTGEEVKLEKLCLRKKVDYDAYKFFIPESKVPTFLDENIWPQNIIFRRFEHYSQRRKNEYSLKVGSVNNNNDS